MLQEKSTLSQNENQTSTDEIMLQEHISESGSQESLTNESTSPQTMTTNQDGQLQEKYESSASSWVESSFQNPSDLTGYIHKISDVRSPSSGNSYFEFQIQTSPTKAVRTLCYSPDKRRQLKEFQEKKIAINIDNIQASTKRSRFFPNKVNYDYDETFSQSLYVLSNIKHVSDFQTIATKCKVLKQSAPESINVRGTVLKKIDYIVGDENKTIKLVVWEGSIVIDIGKSYIMENLSVRSFNDEKYLSTTKYSKSIELTENIECMALDENTNDLYGKQIQAYIKAVNVIKYKSCSICSTKIQIENKSETVKCPKCKLSQYIEDLNDSSISKIVLKNTEDSTVSTYTVLGSVLDTFLQVAFNKNLQNMTEDELLQIFKNKQLTVTISEKDKLISKIYYSQPG